MTVTELDNLPRLNAALTEYLKHTKLTLSEALLKQGRKLGFEVANRLKKFTPAKGAIRRDREGKGVRLRESVANWTPKRLKRGQTLREARRERELNLRERGRGYLPYSTRLQLGALRKGGTVTKEGRYGQLLAKAGLRFDADSQLLVIAYGGDRAEVGDVLAKPRYARAVNAALGEVAADIELYLDRKLL